MSYNYDQTWPVEPRGRTPCPFCQGSQDVVASDAIQTWSRHKRWFKKGEMAFSVLIQVGISPLIMLYDPTHSAARQIPRLLHIQGRHYQIPHFIRDPSPVAFMLACLVYAVSAAACYNLHANDRHQLRCLFFAIGLALFLSSATSTHNISIWLPLTITTALLLSAFSHHAFPSLRSKAIEEVERVECKHDEPQYQDSARQGASTYADQHG